MGRIMDWLFGRNPYELMASRLLDNMNSEKGKKCGNCRHYQGSNIDPLYALAGVGDCIFGVVNPRKGGSTTRASRDATDCRNYKSWN